MVDTQNDAKKKFPGKRFLNVSVSHPELVSFVVRSGNTGGFLGLVDVGALLAEVEVRMTTTSHSLQPTADYFD